VTVVSEELVTGGVRAIRRSGLWWGVGIVAMAVITAAFWPSLEGSEALSSFEDMEDLLEAFGAQNIATPAGYLDGQLYALMLPLLFSGLAIATVTALTSGDEDAGRLEFVHALPVSRRGVWLGRWTAAVLVLLAVAAAAAVTMVVLRPVFSYAEVSWIRLVVATFAGALLGAFHAAVAYAVGGWGGSRGRAVGVATIVLVAGYVAALLVPLVDALEWVRVLSPWHWALREQPATNGVHAGGLLLLAGVTALLVWLGTAAVERRDIRPA
jgi:ABC-2 type transport system permease protein